MADLTTREVFSTPRTLPLIMILLLALIPATVSAEETAPVNECRSSFDVYLPTVFADLAGQTQQAQGGRQGAGGAASVHHQGDFNGDGCADLAVGVQDTRLGTQIGPRRGAVQIFYGRAGSLLESAPQTLLITDNPGSRFGFAPVAGDFDNDGFSDFAVSDPYQDVGGAADAGVVYVFYGSPAGLSATPRSIFHQDVPGVPDRVEAGDRLGWSLASGKFNAGDRFADLAIGVPYEDAGDTADAGYVIILYGSEQGVVAQGAQDFRQDFPGVEGSPEPDDRFGYALAAGDFDGDNFFDLVVGTPYEDRAFEDNVGRVDIFYNQGRTETWWQEDDGLLGSREENDYFGFAAAAGDFNADGNWDLDVGAPGEDVDGNTSENSGALLILYGSESGLQGDGSHFILMPDFVSGARLGHAITAGDFDGDQYVDLAAGAPGADIPFDLPLPNLPGQVLLSRGSAAGLERERLLEAADLPGYDLQSFGRSLE